MNRATGWFYWKMLITVLFKNPKAIESAVNLAAMFIHFQKQSQFIINVTNKEIEYIERFGEESYNQRTISKNNHTKQQNRESIALTS